MTMTIRAHYDGKVIVPDEPVNWPVDQPLRISVEPDPTSFKAPASEERMAAIDRIAARAVRGARIPDDALRRENLYDDRA